MLIQKAVQFSYGPYGYSLWPILSFRVAEWPMWFVADGLWPRYGTQTSIFRPASALPSRLLGDGRG